MLTPLLLLAPLPALPELLPPPLPLLPPIPSNEELPEALCALPVLLLLLPLLGRCSSNAAAADAETETAVLRCVVVRAIGPPTSMGDSHFGGNGEWVPFSEDCDNLRMLMGVDDYVLMLMIRCSFDNMLYLNPGDGVPALSSECCDDRCEDTASMADACAAMLLLMLCASNDDDDDDDVGVASCRCCWC